jgi:hypothetical protein
MFIQRRRNFYRVLSAPVFDLAAAVTAAAVAATAAVATATAEAAAARTCTASTSATCARTTAGTTRTAGAARTATHNRGLAGKEAFALQLLARKLAGAANGFSLFAGLLLGGFFIVAAELHLAENALTLHLLLEGLERLIDIIVANDNLHEFYLEFMDLRNNTCPKLRGRTPRCFEQNGFGWLLSNVAAVVHGRS